MEEAVIWLPRNSVLGVATKKCHVLKKFVFLKADDNNLFEILVMVLAQKLKLLLTNNAYYGINTNFRTLLLN